MWAVRPIASLSMLALHGSTQQQPSTSHVSRCEMLRVEHAGTSHSALRHILDRRWVNVFMCSLSSLSSRFSSTIQTM